MALRTFHSNPSLGGFGRGSQTRSQDDDPVADGDAIVQIVKELVDNAIDACSIPTTPYDDTPAEKRVRVTIEPIMSQQHDDNDDTGSNGGTKPQLMRVTVTDNGGGMDDIQRCVDPFQSNKQQTAYFSQPKDGNNDDDQDPSEQPTLGRYGIGLTLCLLHGQRLVPNSSAQITSSTQDSSHWVNTIWVVDTEDDTVKCVKQWLVKKTNAVESGTKVSILLPGGAAAERAWSRLEEYFNRFHLSFDLHCTLEILAPTLSRVPLYIKPPLSPNNRDDSSESRSENSVSQQMKAMAKATHRLLAIRHSAEKYTARTIEPKNIAHCRFPIRNDTSQTDLSLLPYLEVTLMVVSPNDEDGATPKDDAEPLHEYSDNESTSGDMANDNDPSNGQIRLIRLVNNIPMLDTLEMLACGLVIKIASLRQTWVSFGLEVGLSRSHADATTPIFEVRDSDQILPFLTKGTHEMFEDGNSESDDDSDESSNSDDPDKHMSSRRRQRRSNALKVALPARVRFADALMTVHLHGTPSTLPLPTLSKGCLPADNKAMDDALELGLTKCLRSLQRSNPSLLFSASILQASERDARYIPLLAAAVTSIVQGFESRSNEETNATLRSWMNQPCAPDSSQSSADSDDSSSRHSQDSDHDGSNDENAHVYWNDLALAAATRMRVRLEQSTAPADDADHDDQSTSSSDHGRATKKPFQNLLDSSSEVASKVAYDECSAASQTGKKATWMVDCEDDDLDLDDDWF